MSWQLSGLLRFAWSAVLTLALLLAPIGIQFTSDALAAVTAQECEQDCGKAADGCGPAVPCMAKCSSAPAIQADEPALIAKEPADTIVSESEPLRSRPRAPPLRPPRA